MIDRLEISATLSVELTLEIPCVSRALQSLEIIGEHGDVSERRGPIGTRTELWSETEGENNAERRGGNDGRRVVGRVRPMQAGLRYPGLWATCNPSTTTTTTTRTTTTMYKIFRVIPFVGITNVVPGTYLGE
ncbi:uncharacterized protein LOC143145672 [Ptiloglossa arizonensis]|uniref:uncharacterized protein LOC143145672 n=1 Tax=Ptiloglossa arizonensis TaxID=3350558 RepID=UPI003FA077FC